MQFQLKPALNRSYALLVLFVILYFVLFLFSLVILFSLFSVLTSSVSHVDP